MNASQEIKYKPTRTRAHENVICKAWRQRKELRVIICNITFNGISSTMNKAMREHNKKTLQNKSILRNAL